MHFFRSSFMFFLALAVVSLFSTISWEFPKESELISGLSDISRFWIGHWVMISKRYMRMELMMRQLNTKHLLFTNIFNLCNVKSLKLDNTKSFSSEMLWFDCLHQVRSSLIIPISSSNTSHLFPGTHKTTFLAGS